MSSFSESWLSNPYNQQADYLRLYRSVDPATEPITKDQAKLHLNIGSDTSHDDELDILIESARQKYEEDTDSGIISQTWVQYFPVLQDGLRLTKSPLASVTSITYYDEDNAQQTLSTSIYAADTTTGEIRLKADQEWPNTYSRWDCVAVTYVVGYVDADAVPAQIKHALLLLLGHSFDGDRGDNPNPPMLKSYYNLIANQQRASYP